MDEKRENIRSPEKNSADIMRFVENHPGIKIKFIRETADGYEVIYLEANVPTTGSRLSTGSTTGYFRTGPSLQDFINSLPACSSSYLTTPEKNQASSVPQTPLSGNKKEPTFEIPSLSSWVRDNFDEICSSAGVHRKKLDILLNDLKGKRDLIKCIEYHGLDGICVIEIFKDIWNKMANSTERRSDQDTMFMVWLESCIKRCEEQICFRSVTGYNYKK